MLGDVFQARGWWRGSRSCREVLWKGLGAVDAELRAFNINGTGVGVGVLCTMHISQPVDRLHWTVPFRLFVL